MPTKTYVKDGGSWREITETYYKRSGSWTLLKEVWCKDSGTWRRVYVSNETLSMKVGNYSGLDYGFLSGAGGSSLTPQILSNTTPLSGNIFRLVDDVGTNSLWLDMYAEPLTNTAQFTRDSFLTITCNSVTLNAADSTFTSTAMGTFPETYRGAWRWPSGSKLNLSARVGETIPVVFAY